MIKKFSVVAACCVNSVFGQTQDFDYTTRLTDTLTIQCDIYERFAAIWDVIEYNEQYKQTLRDPGYAVDLFESRPIAITQIQRGYQNKPVVWVYDDLQSNYFALNAITLNDKSRIITVHRSDSPTYDNATRLTCRWSSSFKWHAGGIQGAAFLSMRQPHELLEGYAEQIEQLVHKEGCAIRQTLFELSK